MHFHSFFLPLSPFLSVKGIDALLSKWYQNDLYPTELSKHNIPKIHLSWYMSMHYLQKEETCEAGLGDSPVILAHGGRLRQEGCCEFESTLGYTVNSGSDWAIIWDSCLKQQCAAWLCTDHWKCYLLRHNHVPRICSMPSCSTATSVTSRSVLRLFHSGVSCEQL